MASDRSAPQVSNVIFEGPAGTGKTTKAKEVAVRIIEGDAAPTDLAGISERYRHLVQEGRIIAPTLHPTYAYADWIEGFRPGTDSGGNLIWKIKPGIFLEAVRACGTLTPGLARHFKRGEVIVSSTGASFTVDQVEGSRVILKRHDQRKNQRSDRDEVAFSDVQNCIEQSVGPQELSYSGATEETREKRANVAARLGWSTPKMTSTGGLRAVLESVLAKQTSGSGEPGPIVLVVDEINRADPGRLWGELITILEPSKRAGQPEWQEVQLQYSRERLSLPANLHIIGTMNSADRSIAQFDVAYRRRFDFIWVGPEESRIEMLGGVDLQALLRRVNQYIRRQLGKNRQIGHSELMAHKLAARREEHAWTIQPDGELRAVAYTLRAWLLPLLRDVFGGDLHKVRSALGKWGGLVEVIEDDLEEEADSLWADEAELLDDTGAWWDPLTTDWDAERVKATLHVGAGPAGAIAA
ncbi:hypothetical protein ASG60_18355 [Methylobacterium sp. Leaf469]|uniref:AAA family ATPase n=1 Tax=Methylobacterium sp. Leaf469 TaxID=1736387 RepID=UPI0006FB7ABD|nr:AAA family ATPase [Methylobacterium sp. Leaf469]KQU01814.1 hypothetical protein ASG60_18355 [Methylobacterium sp. Leaf469]